MNVQVALTQQYYKGLIITGLQQLKENIAAANRTEKAHCI